MTSATASSTRPILTSTDSTIAEARHILFTLGLESHADYMNQKEQRFVEAMAKNLLFKQKGGVEVNENQLARLRELKEKYIK